MIEPRHPIKIIDTWLAFPPTAVQPNEWKLISVSPVADFKPKRLVVDPDCASAFWIDNLQIDRDSVPFGHQALAATLFPPVPNILTDADRELFEKLLAIDMPPCAPDRAIDISVRNRSDKPAVFSAALFGRGLVY